MVYDPSKTYSKRQLLERINKGSNYSTPVKLLDAQGSTNNAPSSSSDGVNIEDFETLNIYYKHATSGNTSEIKIWLYDGTDWYPDVKVSLDQDKDILDPYDASGWKRIYTELTAAPSNTVTVKEFPNNE